MKEEEVLKNLIRRYPVLEGNKEEIREAYQTIINCYSNQGKLLLCGNGGSCADADHIVGELMKRFEKERPIDKILKDKLQSVSPERGAYIAGKLQNALPAISLNAHTALYSAISNDMDPHLVFAQQIAGYGKKNDVLIAMSTSGNSQNIIDAAITARAKGLKVIGMTGQHGGSLKIYCDVAICVPSVNTAEIQEYHQPIYHTICSIVENRLFQ